MKTSIFLFLFIAAIAEFVTAKPQNVQIEKQVLIKMPEEDTKNSGYLRQLPILINDNDPEGKTKDILDKISEINEKYLKEATQNDTELVDVENDQSSSKEQKALIDDPNEDAGLLGYASNPYQNPLIDYLNAGRTEFHPNFKISEQNNEVDFNNVVNEDGQNIKRKIFHKVSYLVPNPMFQASSPFIQQIPFQNPSQQLPNYQKIEDDSVITYPLPSAENQDFTTRIGSPSSIQSSQIHNNALNQQLFYPTNFQPFNRNAYYKSPYNPNPIPNSAYQNVPTTKQFQWQWPLSGFFPVLIRDPFLSVLNGFTGIIEYGPQVDICNKEMNKNKAPKNTKLTNAPLTKGRQRKANGRRRGKSFEAPSKESLSNLTLQQNTQDVREKQDKSISVKTQNSPAIETKNSELNNSSRSSKLDLSKVSSIDNSKIFTGPFKPVKGPESQPIKKESSNNEKEDNKILRPFSPLPSSVTNPGFFINRLRVRKGGVAIAGPGGVATAGGGGTAIVGPGGVAYTKPDGVAIVGPGTKIVALPEDIDLNQLIEGLTRHKIIEGDENYNKERQIEGEYISGQAGSTLKKIFIPRGAKVVATGPSIYHNPKSNIQI